MLDGTIATVQILQIDGAVTSAKTGVGGLTQLASTDVTSATAAIVFDSSVVTAFDNYLIILNGIQTASSAANGSIMFSTDNGSTFIGRTRFTANTTDLNAGSVGSAHTGTFSLNSVTNPTMWDNHNTEPLCGQFYFQNCNPLNDNTYTATLYISLQHIQIKVELNINKVCSYVRCNCWTTNQLFSSLQILLKI